MSETQAIASQPVVTNSEVDDEEFPSLKRTCLVDEQPITVLQVGKRFNHRLDWLIPYVTRSRRVVTLTLDMEELELVKRKKRYFRGSEKVRRISLYDIKDIRPSSSTMNFQRWGSKLDHKLCFSIEYIYTSARLGLRHCRIESFFLQSGSVQERDTIVQTLQELVSDAKAGRLRHPGHRIFSQSNSRAAFWENIIRQHDYDKDGSLNVVELADVLKVVGFKKDAEVIAAELIARHGFSDKVEISTFSKALWDLKQTPRMISIFQEAFGIDPEHFSTPKDMRGLVSKEMLLGFLEQTQLEEQDAAEELADKILKQYGLVLDMDADKPPPAKIQRARSKLQGFMDAVAETTEHVKETVRSSFIDLQDDVEEIRMLDFAGFYDFLTDPKENCVIRHPRDGAIELSYPLSHYYISSSHNTYLRGDQLIGSAGVAAYVTAFQLGFACVEVDLWDGSGNEPIITHGMTVTEKMPFEAFVNVLMTQAYSRGDKSPPIIISLENHASKAQQKVAAESLIAAFGERIIRRAEPRLTQLPTLQQCLGKLLIKASFEQVTEPLLSSLVLLQIEKYLGDNAWPEMLDRPADSCLNISESQFRRIEKKNMLKLFAQNHIVRVYPYGLRVDSSNLDPLVCWSVGCQIAALNIQKQSRAMIRNYTLFQSSLGYSHIPTQLDLKLKVEIRVYLGSLLPGSSQKQQGLFAQIRLIDFSSMYIDPESHEEEEDQPAEEYRYDVGEQVIGNAFNPDFGGAPILLETKSAKTSLVRFYIKNSSNTTLAVGGCPILDLRPGYRSVPLVAPSLKPFEFTHSTLLVQATRLM